MDEEPTLVCNQIQGFYKMVESSSEFSELFTAGGGLSMEGWGASASVTVSATENMNLSTSSLTAVSSMRFLSEPIIALNPSNLDHELTLSPSAIELLETQGPDAFHERHGTHYIAGYMKGGYLIGSYTMEYESQQKAASVAASVQAKFEGAVASGGASANFENSLDKSEKATHTRAQYFCRGWSNKTPPKLICKLADLEAAHDGFNPEEGVKLAAILRSYLDIPQYGTSRGIYYKNTGKTDSYDEVFVEPDNYGIIIHTLNREYGRLCYLYQYLKDTGSPQHQAISNQAGQAMKRFTKLLTTACGTKKDGIRKTLKDLETFIVVCQADETNATSAYLDRFNDGRAWINANFIANSLEAQLKALSPAAPAKPQPAPAPATPFITPLGNDWVIDTSDGHVRFKVRGAQHFVLHDPGAYPAVVWDSQIGFYRDELVKWNADITIRANQSGNRLSDSVQHDQKRAVFGNKNQHTLEHLIIEKFPPGGKFWP